MFKALILILIAFGFCFDLYTSWLSEQWRKNHPLPDNVADVYDEAEYARWEKYSAEKKRVSLCGSFISAVLLAGMFAFNGFAALSRALSSGEYANSVQLVLVWTLISTLVSLPFGYVDQMKIEQKYGFNRTNLFTFILDEVKEFVVGAGLLCTVVCASIACWHALGGYFILAVYLFIAVLMLVISTFSLTFMKLFNKFRPLEEGSLRSRLEELFTRNGYKIRNIYVMDASKRTTKANAFCAGLGKYKEIALYDNLVDNFSEDEILAVFAHELTHFKHNDTRILTLLNLIRFLPAAMLIYLMAVNPQLLGELGFDGVHFGMILITVMEAAFMPIMTILSVPINAISRRCERRADAYAARIGLGEAMVSALKKLARGNFSNLNPHPLNVKLSYSHPPISERVRLMQGKG